MKTRTLVAALAIMLPAHLKGQDHAHQAGMTHPGTPQGTTAAPQRPGQAAFGAIAEIVAILRADPATDWTKVDVERLRQHLIDMDDVTMRSVVRQDTVPGGARFTVTGEGCTVEAIRRMARAHVEMVGGADSTRMTVDEISGGVKLTVVATVATARDVARIRGLGFHGLLTFGDHHGPHHLAIARGETAAGHAREE